jgi:hypothetical protein
VAPIVLINSILSLKKLRGLYVYYNILSYIIKRIL